jgi:hypothetical protein
MKNWQAIKCIVPEGEGKINADRIQMLRVWFPQLQEGHHFPRNFPLSGDYDRTFVKNPYPELPDLPPSRNSLLIVLVG